MVKNWLKLACRPEELQLVGTLNGGQSFRWKLIKDKDEERWIGVFSNKVWILKQNDTGILYQVHEAETENCIDEEYYNNLLKNYFQLNLNLTTCYAEWASKDPIFQKASKQFYGIRILNQDLVENIFSFICSSNNNISRITGMVEKLASFYGRKICEVDGITYCSFPNVSSLAQANVEDKLKKEGFGYRAKYISQTAKYIVEQGDSIWLDSLKKLPYEEAKIQLMALTGIGPKVADCICLMSLGHLQAIPVDTHVYQIARNFYLPKLAKHKTVTSKIYQEIGDHFRNLYGPLAGWAHTILFCADLKKFQQDRPSESKGKKA